MPTLFTDYERDAAEWIRNYPEGWRAFEALALEAAGKGRRFGAKAIAEVIRWEMSVRRGDGDFKVNNNIVSHLVREVVRRHPWVGEYVETRRLKA